ncbi:M23 family metallopeptidase [Geochorda subterranea]|uniref:M23 family metallopeptidase n=1 Tax=Geochorda subterranea TaxID=3109564 RepID=A0ABZ1BPZ4_9FIRM|nr:M23 family metallopeptidase [Limnochorda sp. LNt]WRP14655.1 M23 family metallopeptidase [Limnochorda sp. LNt]
MARKRSEPYITIAIVPHDGGVVRSLRLRRRTYDALRAAVGLVLVALLWLSNSYVTALHRQALLSGRLALQLDRYATLERAYIDEQSNFEALMAEAAGIQQELQRLAVASAELREMLARADAVPPPALPPVRQVAQGDRPTGQGGPLSAPDVIPIVAAALRYADDRIQAYDDHFKALRSRTLEFVRMRAHTPSIWPTEGWLSSGYGPRTHPITGQSDYHYGVDIAGMVGTPIRAAADGQVVSAGRRSGYGLTIVIDHGYGRQTLYGHLSRIQVKVGQRVTKGQVIGAMGSTGLSTGPHLHYEVRVNGRPVNPLNYLP